MVVQELISVDGYVADEWGSVDFFDSVADVDEADRDNLALMSDVGIILLARVTSECGDDEAEVLGGPAVNHVERLRAGEGGDLIVWAASPSPSRCWTPGWSTRSSCPCCRSCSAVAARPTRRAGPGSLVGELVAPLNALRPTAYAHRTQRFLLDQLADDTDAWVDRSWAIAHAHRCGRVYPNFPDPGLDGSAAAYQGDNLARLVTTKRATTTRNASSAFHRRCDPTAPRKTPRRSTRT